MVKDAPRFIVAEVSKNWSQAIRPQPLIQALFEDVIEVNRGRGYVLHSFAFSQVMNGPGVINETIIAVFRLDPLPELVHVDLPEPKGKGKK